MKHLFIYILCSLMSYGAYAQTSGTVSPPAKFRTMVAEKAMRSGKFGKKAAAMQQKQKARQVFPTSNMPGDLLRNRVGHPVQVKASKVAKAGPIASDEARITLNVETDWGDGSGYQLILDRDCGIYGMTSLDEIFAAADYAVPEDASYLENFLVAGESKSIDVPAGEYDFYVFNPTPSSGTVYLAGGESQGDNYYFKGGYEYVFTVNLAFTQDNVELTCDSPVDLGVSKIISPSTGKDLTSAEDVTATFYNEGTEAVSSFIAKLTVDGGETISETVDTPIAPGDNIDYTFKAKADLSVPGLHSVTVSVDNEKDGLSGNNSMTKKVTHVAALPAPFTCDFSQEGSVDYWTIIDANQDGTTWTISPETGAAEILFNSELATDDYMVTTCPITLPAGTNNFVIDYNALVNSFIESFEILYGKTSDVSEMKVLKSYDDFVVAADGYKGIINFDLDESGDYYFAIHGTSQANQYGIDVYKVVVAEGSYIGSPDLSVDKVTLPMSSCSLGTEEKVSVTLSNKGTADAKDFTVEYSVNGTVKGSQKFDKVVPVGESVEVTLDDVIDMSAVGKYSVGVNVTDVTPADGQNPETITDNNSGEASVTHYTPTDVPFVVDFNNETQREDWSSDDSWVYDGDYYSAMYCVGTTPLVSRGVNLKAGKTYRLSYNYMAGMFYFMFVVYDSYDIILGAEGTPVSDWSTIASYSDIYTNDAFTDDEVTFTVPADGVYSLGFKQDTPQGTFMLRSAEVAEVAPYDVAITSMSGLPSQLPKSQAEDLSVDVVVKNKGSEPASGTIALTADGKQVGSAKFETIPVGESLTVSVPATLSDVPSGTTDVTAEATLDGEEDNNLNDNMASASLEMTDDVYAYDYVTDGMYDDYHAIGLGEGYLCTAGIIFHINKTADLKGLSIGWGMAEDEQIGLSVYKWDNNATPDDYGYIPVGEEVYSTTAERGGSTGQVDYMFDELTTLAPGDYMMAVTYTGYGLAVDNVLPGQLYLLTDETGSMCAVDQSSAGLGTPAIRAILGETTGIGSVATAAMTPAIVYDAASKTIVASSPSGAIKSLEVYSASGSLMGKMSAGSTVCRYEASKLTSGVYVVKMKTADKTVTGKIAVK